MLPTNTVTAGPACSLRFEKLGGLEEAGEEEVGVTPGGAGGRAEAWGMWRGRMGRAIMGPMGIGCGETCYLDALAL